MTFQNTLELRLSPQILFYFIIFTLFNSLVKSIAMCKPSYSFLLKLKPWTMDSQQSFSFLFFSFFFLAFLSLFIYLIILASKAINCNLIFCHSAQRHANENINSLFKLMMIKMRINSAHQFVPSYFSTCLKFNKYLLN